MSKISQWCPNCGKVFEHEDANIEGRENAPFLFPVKTAQDRQYSLSIEFPDFPFSEGSSPKGYLRERRCCSCREEWESIEFPKSVLSEISYRLRGYQKQIDLFKKEITILAKLLKEAGDISDKINELLKS